MAEIVGVEGGLLTPRQVADLLGVSENALAIWRHNRRGPSYLKFGRQIRYPGEAINEFFAESLRECDPAIARRS